jgi:Cu+-exporting ATPase
MAAIRQVGFGASEGTPDILAANQAEEEKSSREFRFAALGAAPLMMIEMWPMLFGAHIISAPVDGLLQAVLAALILFRAGSGILLDAFKQTRHFRANMNSLIALGSLTAFGWSLFALAQITVGLHDELYFESAGMIIALVLLGRMLEARTRRKAGRAIEALVSLQPSKATAIINGVEVDMEASAARRGMLLLVKPGERIPADGVVTEGSPVTDESILTGESTPVDKRPGAKVIGGSLNGSAPFKMQVTADAADSFLSGVIRLVGEAQSRKAPIQRLADRIAAVFVPIVLVIAMLTGLIWWLVAPSNPMLIKAVVSVLIIACPCVSAWPRRRLYGGNRSGRTRRHHLKGGDVVERLSHVNIVVFDKTGTLTKGSLEVVGIKTFGKVTEQNLIRVVGSAESQSEHPVGAAIARLMRQRQISSVVVKNVLARPGFGVTAECDGRPLVVGNRALMEAEKVSFGPALLQGERDMEKGHTVVFAAMDGQVVGIISLADQVRGDARELVEELRDSMQRVTMISGDNRKTAAGVARTLGLDDFEAEIKPDQKQLIIDSYRRAGYTVAMIGDGINDAPALAAADVGVAVGSGADLAIEAADVVLVRPELAVVSRMFRLSKQTVLTIKQNLFWALFYNVTAIPVAAGVLYPVIGLMLSPMIAALAMSLSSVFVVSNSLRLSKIDL